jgi:hypothetical protein
MDNAKRRDEKAHENNDRQAARIAASALRPRNGPLIKAPSSAELALDYLWRIHKCVPPLGNRDFQSVSLLGCADRAGASPGARGSVGETLPSGQHWDEYHKAYEDALRKCSTERAPWYIIPSNRKWLRNHVIAELIVRALDEMKLKYPAPTVDISVVLS